MQNGGKIVTVRSKWHLLLGKSLNPSEPQFPCLPNENSNSVYCVELQGTLSTFVCKMLVPCTAARTWAQMLFLSTFNVFGSVVGTV